MRGPLLSGPASPNGRNIAAPVKNAENLDAVPTRTAEDDVAPNWKTTHFRSEIGASLAQFRLRSVGRHLLLNGSEEAQRDLPTPTLRRNMAADPPEVLTGKRSSNGSAHGLGRPDSSSSATSSCRIASMSSASDSPSSDCLMAA